MSTGYRRLILSALVVGAALPASAQHQVLPRPPAVPLVTHDPYFSIWSMGDQLTGSPTQHWTATAQPMTGLVRIDGKVYRWMSDEPQTLPAMQQVGLEVTATRTKYQFEAGGVHLGVTFLSPLIPSDIELLSRPVTYISWDVSANDGKQHSVQLLLEVSGVLAVNSYGQELTWSHAHGAKMTVLRAGSFEQPTLQRAGDDVRIDWGFAFLGIPDDAGTTASTASQEQTEAAFIAGNALDTDDIDVPRTTASTLASDASAKYAELTAAGKQPTPQEERDLFKMRPDRRGIVLAGEFDLGQVAGKPTSRHVLLGYDERYSIEYFKRPLRPYWRRNGMEVSELLRKSENEYSAIQRRSQEFDQRLGADLRAVGGAAYEQLGALAFRQAIAAYTLAADIDGTALFFPKENTSNGCISTVDVIYPASPLFLLLSPRLMQAQLRPVMDYVRSGRWRFPFAPHDLGYYPKANGQVYGDGELSERDQMPVEETSNLLLLLTALAKVEGTADFVREYWPQLQRWAEYLRHEGLDPANQLSTDDFSGHLAHNANLSIKAILGLAGYARLADLLGQKSEARQYRAIVRDMAQHWVRLAGDGDHYRLAFDAPGTWSEKYNLAWDRILGLNVFAKDIARTELQYYKSHIGSFGLPLDSRSAYTKLDWQLWTASMAEERADLDLMLAPIQKFINTSPSRVPLSDFYWTSDGRDAGMHARSVVGGVYMLMLADQAMWKKWVAEANGELLSPRPHHHFAL